MINSGSPRTARELLQGIDFSSKMFSNSYKHAAVLLLALTQSLVFASLDNVEKKTETSARMIIDYVTVPWTEARQWMLNSPESSGVNEVRALIRGIESGEMWAWQMLDELLKIDRKILNRKIRGNEISNQPTEANARCNHTNIQDNSCPMVSLATVFLISGLSSSTCDPLSRNEIRGSPIVNRASQRQSLTKESDIGASNLAFPQVAAKDFTTGEISTIIFFSSIVIFVIACTICDMVIRINLNYSPSPAVYTLSKCSLYTNAFALLSTRVNPDTMPAIHGIRCLGFCSIIIGHHCLTSLLVLEQKPNLLNFLKVKTSWLGMFFGITQHAVDTFLLISGFLTAYLFFKLMQSGLKFKLPIMYLHRYFRITPCLAVVSLYAMVLSQRIETGPSWATVLNQSANHCQESLWVYLLYVQNLVNYGCTYLPHCWYLTADMQLFWISPVILYPLHRYPKFGLGLLSFIFITSVATPAIILAMNRYSNAIIRLDTNFPTFLKIFRFYFIPTYNRASPYLVGIFLGYYVTKQRKPLTQVNVAINWLITGSLMLLCIWSTNRVYNSNFAYDLTMETFYTAIVRPSWSIAIAWIIYACTQGYGGLATRFLSLPIFFPLSRLAYCTYLVHFGIQAATVTPLHHSVEYYYFKVVCGICRDLVLSITVAFVLSLFVESPVIALAKIFTNHGRQPEQITLVRKPQKNKTTVIEG